MALLPILEFPDPRLRTVAVPVTRVDARIQQLVDDMFETMYADRKSTRLNSIHVRTSRMPSSA